MSLAIKLLKGENHAESYEVYILIVNFQEVAYFRSNHHCSQNKPYYFLLQSTNGFKNVTLVVKINPFSVQQHYLFNSVCTTVEGLGTV